MELELKQDGLTNTKSWVASGKEENFKCSQCLKEINEGFMCENNKKLILCLECQDNFQMSKCKHDKIKEHKHIKWIKSNAK